MSILLSNTIYVYTNLIAYLHNACLIVKQFQDSYYLGIVQNVLIDALCWISGANADEIVVTTYCANYI